MTKAAEAEMARAMDALARAYIEGDEGTRLSVLHSLGVQPERFIEASARLWPLREREIERALKARASSRRDAKEVTQISVESCMHMLRLCAEMVSADSQRVAVPQSELRRVVDWTATRTSKALAELRAVGALFGPFPSGYSQEWEVDASYASALGEAARLEALHRQVQTQQVEREGVVQLREANPGPATSRRQA